MSSPLQLCTGTIRVLAYGTSAYMHDEYLRISETITRDSLTRFVECVISCFGEEYLIGLNRADLVILLHVGEECGFPGTVGNIDCMHWAATWARGKAKIILEVVASYDLWIWHVFFGTPSLCNDVNVFHRSPIFSDVLTGQASNVSYVVNGRENKMTYNLTDGIYPSWAAFVKSITYLQLWKHKLFAEH